MGPFKIHLDSYVKLVNNAGDHIVIYHHFTYCDGSCGRKEGARSWQMSQEIFDQGFPKNRILFHLNYELSGFYLRINQ